jgi:hypothetical protein
MLRFAAEGSEVIVDQMRWLVAAGPEEEQPDRAPDT